MTTNFEDIRQFHEHHRLPGSRSPILLDDDLYDFRLRFMIEEIREFEMAHDQADLARAADALIDLVYVAMGTAYHMGLPWELIWKIVHMANMRKVRASELMPGARGTPKFDVVKPDGWIGPDDATLYILRMLGGRC